MITHIESLLTWIDNFFALPTTILFLGVAVLLTIKMGFLQFRAFPHFISMVTKGFKGKDR